MKLLPIIIPQVRTWVLEHINDNHVEFNNLRDEVENCSEEHRDEALNYLSGMYSAVHNHLTAMFGDNFVIALINSSDGGESWTANVLDSDGDSFTFDLSFED
jgi:hypothetical protein